MTVRPKGYVGTNHETVGSDILSIFKAIQLPELLLGKDLADAIARVEPSRWYPIKMLLEPIELLHQKLGDNSLLRIGSELFRLSHEQAVRANIFSAKELLHGFDGIYHRANRGIHIGGWKVLSFESGKAVMEKTTPHHCILEQGILLEALSTVGVPAMVEQRRCMRRGDDTCEYVITSFVRDSRWSGEKPAQSAARPS